VEQQRMRKTYQYKLNPTAQQERMLERTLPSVVISTTPPLVSEAWRMRGVNVTYHK
jgi:hypothetical protein